ncbi:hypothetical protein MGSAQ_000053 [marine sediment metagenome]|uniref:Uncharacterized protein n=1 Tax=marine sediment metagenome TaxID=412755 RepID=A0A1B6NYG3_9ZZZZ
MISNTIYIPVSLIHKSIADRQKIISINKEALPLFKYNPNNGNAFFVSITYRFQKPIDFKVQTNDACLLSRRTTMKA